MLSRSKRITWVLIAGMLLSVTAFFPYGKVKAEEDKKRDYVIVSLGDSYSSGEGNEPFYKQDKPVMDKIHEPDWLAHRSQIAWSGLLTYSVQRLH